MPGAWKAPRPPWRRLRSEADGSWAVSAEVEACSESPRLATGINRHRRGRHRSSLCRIDREICGSAAPSRSSAGDMARPAMEQLFMGPASERRRFLRPLLLAVDAGLRAASTNWRGRCARQTGCWRNPRQIRIGLMRSSTRPQSSRSRWRRARRNSAPCKAPWASRKDDAFPSAEIALSMAGWRAVPDHPRSRRGNRLPWPLKDNAPAPPPTAAPDGPHLTDLAVTEITPSASSPPTLRPATGRRC